MREAGFVLGLGLEPLAHRQSYGVYVITMMP